jgi:hypothetical protein
MHEDDHLEMDYEDRNGSTLPEHLMGEEGEDIYAGTGANDDLEIEAEYCEECGEEMEHPDLCYNCG